MRILLTTAFMLLTATVFGQTKFITAGRVEYEKKMNNYQLLDNEANGSSWIIEYKKTLPKTVTDIYELKFNSEKSVYKLLKENPDNKYLWNGKPSEADVMVKDIKNNTIAMQREVFETTYLLKDSLRQLEWHLTDETRTIAGFECKKAVTKICDSVYVVAFYTDQVMISSGPETVSGLPGLILGLAVPRLCCTWFASKVELTEPTEAQLSPAQKGKKATWKSLGTDLNKGIKDWGKEGARFMWTFML